MGQVESQQRVLKINTAIACGLLQARPGSFFLSAEKLKTLARKLTNKKPTKSSIMEWWDAMIYKKKKEKREKHGYLNQPRLPFGPVFT